MSAFECRWMPFRGKRHLGRPLIGPLVPLVWGFDLGFPVE